MRFDAAMTIAVSIGYSGKGYPIGKVNAFIGAGVAAIICIYFFVLIFKPERRNGWGSDDGGAYPMSILGCIAWMIFSAAWGTCLFAHAIAYTPITRRTLAIILSAVAIMLLAGLHDWIRYARPRRSRMKSFRVYLREPDDER